MINICVTGHRPNKIYGYDIYTEKYNLLRDKMQEIILSIKKYSNIEHVMCGMALGWDTIAFEEFHFNHSEIKIVGCIPFANQHLYWHRDSDVRVYNEMKKVSHKLVYVDTIDKYKVNGTIDGEWNVIKMQKRNEYMVDNSNVIISCWDGVKKGGTWNCLKYGLKSDNIKKIIIINPKTLNIEIIK